MVESKRTLRGFLADWENVMLENVVRWIIAWRGVEFLYWCDVPAWETFLRENPSYDPQEAGKA